MTKAFIDHYYFKTLADVAHEPFDYVIVGAGAYGTSFAHRMLRLDKKCRILLLDKGGYLIPEHVQNIPPAYVDLTTKAGIRPWKATGTMDMMPQIPYVGGRALFWNAWIPQPPASEMPEWPTSTIDDLAPDWYEAGSYMGRRYSLATPGNDNTQLQEQVRETLFSGSGRIDTAIPCGKPTDLNSAMATGQNMPPSQWKKFSPIDILINDVQTFCDRLAVVPDCEVLKMNTTGKQVTGLETVQGSVEFKNATVILALNTLEAAALAIPSFPNEPLIGKNLSGHLRSWLAFRVPRSTYPQLSDKHLQTVGLYLRGEDKSSGRFMHTHITAAYNPQPERDLSILYKVLPDASTQHAVNTYQDPNYIVFMLHAMGEFLGKPSVDSWNYVGVKDNQMIVHVVMQPEDNRFWDIMSEGLYQTIAVLADHHAIEYQQPDGSWAATPPENIRNTGLVHESGTFWMGHDPHTSVTTPQGRLHCAENVYGTGSMLFPRPGSFNPTLTGVAMAFGLARRLAKQS